MTKLTLRKLKSKDLFTFTRFFKKIGAGEIVDQFYKQVDIDATDESAVIDRGKGIIGTLTNVLFENIDTIETELNEFLADMTETNVETIQELDINEFAELVIELVQKEELKDFLSSFGHLVKPVR